MKLDDGDGRTHLLTERRIIFILLRSLNAPGEAEEEEQISWEDLRAEEEEAARPPPLSQTEDLRLNAAAAPCWTLWPAFQQYRLLTEGGALEVATSFLPFSVAFLRSSAPSAGGVAAALGDAHLRKTLAEEETHLYLEVLWAAAARLRLRSDFLPGVFLPGAAVAADDVEAAAVAAALTGRGDGFSSTPPTPCLFFTQVNWDFLGKAAPTWRFDDLTIGAADSGVLTPDEVDGVAASRLVLPMIEALPSPETSFCSHFREPRRSRWCWEVAADETAACFSRAGSVTTFGLAKVTASRFQVFPSLTFAASSLIAGWAVPRPMGTAEHPEDETTEGSGFLFFSE